MIPNTIHEQKAFYKTLIIMSLLIISFFYIGMTYLDPPIEKGIEIVMIEEDGAEINYGTSIDGKGDVQPMSNEKPEPSAPTKSVEKESYLTKDNDDDVPVVKPKTKNTKTETKQENPKPDKSTENALKNILNAPSGENQNSKSEVDGSGAGDKGQIDGNPYANAYYGGGTGSGSGYGLNGRNRKSNQKYEQECNESGKVVVRIEVDRNGSVVKAEPGVKGTTNSNPCLMEPAKKTALSYRFNSDPKAPARQIGFVVVNFKLGQ